MNAIKIIAMPIMTSAIGITYELNGMLKRPCIRFAKPAINMIAPTIAITMSPVLLDTGAV